MECSYFGECGSCTLFELDYESQLNFKISELKKEFDTPFFSTFESKRSFYRNRAEFKIFHQENRIDFAMSGTKTRYITIKNCPKADENINFLMPKLKEYLQGSEILSNKLFRVEFLSSKDEMLITLIYHKPLTKEWEEKARLLAKELKIGVIGRSRGVKIVIDKEFVKERLNILEKEYCFNFYEGSFTQPNRSVNEKMIGWVKNEISSHKKSDLLELYCGHGNFTIPLSESFNLVLATEISKKSIKSAHENMILNGVKNISFVRLSSEELVEALNESREFKRLSSINLKEYNFSHILVDPPRAGLDKASLNFIKDFQNIIYISCNPSTLFRDLHLLKKTHKISSFAFFDQFPYTNHLECGVILKPIKEL
ncbi:MAG: tRNA (uridine(54)-C5)-methyltransferase TrmA [Campylobacterales bacterium]|nr:tRNA (uridine(54)-C5)-methyltransferase TrmA [Campylobacterales bacterium]